MVTVGPGGLSLLQVDEGSASLPLPVEFACGVLLRRCIGFAVEGENLEKHGLLEVLRDFKEEKMVENILLYLEIFIIIQPVIWAVLNFADE